MLNRAIVQNCLDNIIKMTKEENPTSATLYYIQCLAEQALEQFKPAKVGSVDEFTTEGEIIGMVEDSKHLNMEEKQKLYYSMTKLRDALKRKNDENEKK